MKLSGAFLCLDCDEVFHKTQSEQTCPGCGGKYAYPIINFIKASEEIIGVTKELVLDTLRKSTPMPERGDDGT